MRLIICFAILQIVFTQPVLAQQSEKVVEKNDIEKRIKSGDSSDKYSDKPARRRLKLPHRKPKNTGW